MVKLINFGKETLDKMNKWKKTPEDVKYVVYGKYGTSGEVKVTFSAFIDVANQIEYDGGYGLEYINTFINILFNDGSWMERREYDGSEWWEYHCTPSYDGPITDDISVDDILLHKAFGISNGKVNILNAPNEQDW
jgi:hypothetical protein